MGASPRRALLLGVSFYIIASPRTGRLTVRWICGRATAFQGSGSMATVSPCHGQTTRDHDRRQRA
jgi:hypothetical protein